MGMVSPYSARLFVHELPRMGTGVGLIYGISTVGSIIGTLATTFYLMTFLGTRTLAWGNGIVLGGLGLALLMAAFLSGEPLGPPPPDEAQTISEFFPSAWRPVAGGAAESPQNTTA